MKAGARDQRAGRALRKNLSCQGKTKRIRGIPQARSVRKKGKSPLKQLEQRETTDTTCFQTSGDTHQWYGAFRYFVPRAGFSSSKQKVPLPAGSYHGYRPVYNTTCNSSPGKTAMHGGGMADSGKIISFSRPCTARNCRSNQTRTEIIQYQRALCQRSGPCRPVADWHPG